MVRTVPLKQDCTRKRTSAVRAMTRPASHDTVCRHYTPRRTPALQITNAGNIGNRGHVMVWISGLVSPAKFDWVPGLIVLAHNHLAFKVDIVRNAVG